MAEFDIPAGATAAERTKVLYGRPVRPETSVVNIGATPTRILKNSPRRIGWMIVNRGASDITADFVNAVVLGTGFLIVQNGGYLSATVDEDGELVAWEFWGIVSAGSIPLYVAEFVAL